MSQIPLSARPVSEGIARISGVATVVWRDYRWNTGGVIRDWHIKPDAAEELQIEMCPLDGQRAHLDRS